MTFTGRDVPWATVGRVIDEPDVDLETAIQLGGLDFDVSMQQGGYVGLDGQWQNTPNRYATVRVDTCEFFTFVSDDYQVVQYRDAFSFLAELNPRFVAAGPLNPSGSEGFVVVQLPNRRTLDVSVDGEPDPTDMYCVVRTSHNLSRGIEIAVMPLRQRCMNQLALPSLTRGVDHRWAIPHVGNIHGKIAAAIDSIRRVDDYADEFERIVRRLVEIPVSTDELGIVLRQVLPQRPKTETIITSIQEIFATSPTVHYSNNAWGGVNAVSEYMEHVRPNPSATPKSILTGPLSGEVQKDVAKVTKALIARGMRR
jgi:phage/plasmid-like protein (TIGR03299 family)